MTPRSIHRTEDRIVLSHARHSKMRTLSAQRRSYVWTLAGGVFGSTILLWVMVQLGQASSDPKSKATLSPSASSGHASATATTDIGVPMADPEEVEKPLEPPTPATQGPALDTPREIIDMLDLRKRDLDRREEAVRQNEERLMMVRAEIEQLLAKNEALEKRIQNARAKQDQQATDVKTQQAKMLLDKERQAQDQKSQLAKMYESMPPEEAAARLERMPDRKAVEILRLVKGKTAGSILAQVKVERAAKLTEQLLVQNP